MLDFEIKQVTNHMLVKGEKSNEGASIYQPGKKIIHSGIPEYGSIHEPCPH